MRKVLAFALMLCIGMVFGCGDTAKKPKPGDKGTPAATDKDKDKDKDKPKT
jgi:hypothetical protein